MGDPAENDAGRDAILDAAVRKHDLLYGTDHCDRKYLLSCHRLPEIILSLPTPTRVTPPVDSTGHADHTDPYCATHCIPGVKHSQCACARSHRVTSPAAPPAHACPGEARCAVCRVFPPGTGALTEPEADR